MKNNEIEKTNSRRSFMKKAAYAVPTVIAISQLTSPMAAQAASKLTGNSETILLILQLEQIEVMLTIFLVKKINPKIIINASI